jgi:isopentenyldiphosphate isomerase
MFVVDHDPAAELVDVVDEDDRVIGTVTRRRMRAENLRHRSVGIIVRDVAGRVLVHRRAEDKDVWPGQWDAAVGGVVASGETYDEAARRELAEEIGVVAEPRPIGAATFTDDRVRTVTHLYEVVADGPYHFADGEVVEARLVTLAELGAMLDDHEFVPDARALAIPRLLGGG